MKSKLLLAALLAGAVLSGRAQLYIDAAGPRNLLLAAKGEGQPEWNKFATKLDTEKKGASLGYFTSRDTEKGFATWTAGLLGSISSPNGWDELFKSPLADVSALYNYTWGKPPLQSDGKVEPKAGGPWFVNVSAGAALDNLRVRTTATDPVREEQSTTGKGSLGFGRQMSPRSAVALSVRFERTSNYEDLPKVTVDGRPAREGDLVYSDGTPIALVLTHEFAATPINDLLQLWQNDKANYSLVGAIYGEYDPTTKSATDHKLGLNVTLKRFLIPGAEDLKKRRDAVTKKLELPTGTLDDMSPASFADITFPFNVFVEWKQPFGDKPGEVVTGAAVLFTWP